MSTSYDSIINAERPWPGLLSFPEEAREFFHGRDAEVEDLLRLIEREPLTILFGQSGLGKSSLLKAGGFPRLRRAGYLPVYVRLNYEPDVPLLLSQIWHALQGQCKAQEVDVPPPEPGESFWHYLHRQDAIFLNPHGRPITPVLVFDQFEELFTLGRQDASRIARGQQLIDELGELIENRVPAALESRLADEPECLDRLDLYKRNIKIVFSFREDYLAEFEELKNKIRPILQNRMRLTPMAGAHAVQSLLRAGGDKVSPEVAERIVRFVSGLESTDALEQARVEPALLSLVCRELNEKRLAQGKSAINTDLIEGENTHQIIQTFYQQGFAGLDRRVQYFVEDRLLSAAGYRDSSALDNALAEPGVTETALQTLVDRRLLRREERDGRGRLELIHDILTGPAKASRDARREAEALEEAKQYLQKQRRRQRWFVTIAIVLVAIVGGLSWLTLEVWQAQKITTQQKLVAEAHLVRALKAEA